MIAKLFTALVFCGSFLIGGTISSARPLNCDSNLYALESDYYWSEEIGYIYAGYTPFLYFCSTNSWIYRFETEEDNYFLYDFRIGQFGYSGCDYYPYYASLPEEGESTLVFFADSLPPYSIMHRVAESSFNYSPKVIDGRDDDWDWNTVYFEIESPVHTESDPQWNTLSGVWCSSWDSENLYFYLDITDSYSNWENQSIYLYLSPAYTRHKGEFGDPGYDGVSDAAITFKVNEAIHETNGYYSMDATHDLYSFGNFRNSDGSPKEFVGAVAAYIYTPGGYAAEIAIPWEALTINSDISGVVWDGYGFTGGPSGFTWREFLGFELMVQNQFTYGDRNRVAWFGGPDGRHGNYAWADTSVWGTLRLQSAHF